jgi:hypothetical protein
MYVISSAGLGGMRIHNARSKRVNFRAVYNDCSPLFHDAMQCFGQMKTLEWNEGCKGEGDWSSGHRYPDGQGVCLA